MFNLTTLGLAAVLFVVYKIGAVLHHYLLAAPADFKKYGAKKGAWAVVTGSSDGIGKEMAVYLGKKGFNVVLVSRTKAKLDAVAKDIEAASGVKTKVVAVDLANGDMEENMATIVRAVEKLDVGILVNNVGMSYSTAAHLHEVPTEWVYNIINVNCLASTLLTVALMPKLSKRRASGIVNLSSMSALVPAPMLTAYGASKAFNYAFARDLEFEYPNVDVLNVTPGFVATKMAKIRRASLMVPTAKTFAVSALNKLGVFRHTFGVLPHYAMYLAGVLLPERVVGKMSYNKMRAVQKRAQAKAARKAAAAKEQ